METRREYCLKSINELLSVLEVHLRNNGKDHYFDLHTGIEDPICALLNQLWGCELMDLNRIQMNYPGVDLADRSRRLAVQVSTDGDRSKVLKTLKVFRKHRLQDSFAHIVLLIVGRKPAYRKPFEDCGMELEIFDIADLKQQLRQKDTDLLESILDRLRKAFLFRSGEAPVLRRSLRTDPKTLMEQIPVLQEHYLCRLTNPMIRGADRDLSLGDLYVPNPYVLGDSVQLRDDLVAFLDSFVFGNTAALKKAGVTEENTDTLIIEGQQCTGKSTLVAWLLSRAYFHWGMDIEKVHLLSFIERDLSAVDLTAQGVCRYLGLPSDRRLRDGLLIIDALDESEWFAREARSQLDKLMESLVKYRCRLIVTSRTNYLDAEDRLGILNITLKPFTLDHAERWLDVYGTSDREMDICAIKENLRRVPEELHHVILLPHVLQICVTHGIELGSVVNLNRLYDLIFRGPNGLFLRDQFFPNVHARQKRFRQMLGTAAQIALRCICGGNRIREEELEALLAAGDPRLVRLKTEYLLERREDSSYGFAHGSIPSYLLALDLYEAFSGPDDPPEDELLERIAPIVMENALHDDVLRSLEQMVGSDDRDPGDRAERLLHKLLNDELSTAALHCGGSFRQIQAQWDRWVDGLIRLTIALKVNERDEWGEYRFFEAFPEPAWRRLRGFFAREKEERQKRNYLRCCTMVNRDLSGMDLYGAMLGLKRVRLMVMQGTGFECANLRGAYVEDSDLSAACLEGAYCASAQFKNVLLCSASFQKADLRGARFTGCDLSHADLRGANLSKVVFDECVLRGVKLDAWQLHEHLSLFDLDFIRRNGIRLYMEDCELPDELVADEYRRQRPVINSIRHNKTVFTGGNIRKAEQVRRYLEHQGEVTRSQLTEAFPKISRSTIQQVLSNLLQTGELSKSGGGRFAVYTWRKKQGNTDHQNR